MRDPVMLLPALLPLFILVAHGGIAAPSDIPTFTIPQGTFTGTILTAGLKRPIEAYLGIPYALSTAGEGRFRPPVKVPDSDSTFNATKYGHFCVDSRNSTKNQGEDCLSLNLFRPQVQEPQKLPVLVYIHGGSFNFGSGQARNMAELVAASSVPIIGVSMNYRIGALGFLPSALTAKEGLLNLGLKDQVMAMEWVKENIDAIGGDPERVTIMGDSAGAHSVGHHLQNTEGPSLFHQVILESGAPTARTCAPYNSTLNEQQFKNFTNATGASDLPDDQVMSYLRSLPMARIKTASTNIFDYYNNSIRWPFQPAIDGPGGIIPEAPLTLWQKGHFQKVPVLTGFCTDEGAPFLNLSISTSAQFTSFFRTLIPAFSGPDLATLNTLYPDPLTDPSSPYTDTRRLPGLGAEYKRLTAAYGQYAYIAPTRHTAYFTSSASGQGKGGSLLTQRQTQPPVYLYHFALNSSVLLGTDHDCATPYVTYSYSVRVISPAQKSLAAAVNDYWTSFVATGDPNAVVGKSPERAFWPAYSTGPVGPSGVSNGTAAGKKMVLGRGNDERAGGSNAGVLTQSVTETFAVSESNFWWEREILSEE